MQFGVLLARQDLVLIARPLERHFYFGLYTRLRILAQDYYPICEKQRLIHVVGDKEDGLLGSLPDTK